MATLTHASSALACEDVPLRLGDGATARGRYVNTVICHVLGGLGRPQACVDGATLAAPCEVAPLLTGDERTDFERLREHFRARLHATRALRGQDRAIPDDLAAFRAATGYRAWPARVVRRSAVKRKTRVNYRSPVGFVPPMSVSETLDSETGDRAAPVIDTEIAVARTDGSGFTDFYVYDEATGALATEAPFPGGARASPNVCVACHYDAATRTIRRLMTP